MFPISASIRSKRVPVITLLLIAINILVFVLQIQSNNLDKFIDLYALIPKNINFFNLNTLPPFITAIFLHGGFFHLLSNMWFLWVFGDAVESELGTLKYLSVYFAAGILGNFAQYLLNPASPIPMLGASGAISGILGAYMILFPKSMIKTFMIFIFSVSIVNIPALIYIFYWFILQLFAGILSLPFSYQSGGVAFWAHVGGFLAGAYLVKRIKTPRAPYIEGEIVE